MKTYYVYMLLCSDKSYYIGVTGNIETRIAEHQAGVHTRSYTYNRRPVYLVYLADFINIYEAISWEKQIKRWSRRKKEALIIRDFERLPELASRKILKIAMVRQAHHDKVVGLRIFTVSP